eukprot:g48540.t1
MYAANIAQGPLHPRAQLLTGHPGQHIFRGPLPPEGPGPVVAALLGHHQLLEALDPVGVRGRPGGIAAAPAGPVAAGGLSLGLGLGRVPGFLLLPPPPQEALVLGNVVEGADIGERQRRRQAAVQRQ